MYILSPTPDPASFLRDLFNPQNMELFAIYQRVTALALMDKQVDFWRTELINSSRRDLFTHEGFDYTLQQLNNVAIFSESEKELLNQSLSKYYLHSLP